MLYDTYYHDAQLATVDATCRHGISNLYENRINFLTLLGTIRYESVLLHSHPSVGLLTSYPNSQKKHCLPNRVYLYSMEATNIGPVTR